MEEPVDKYLEIRYNSYGIFFVLVILNYTTDEGPLGPVFCFRAKKGAAAP